MATPNIDDYIPLPSGPNIDDYLPASLDPSSPSGIVEAERQTPSASKLGLRGMLGLGEEGKGQIRSGLGNVIDFIGKAVQKHPLVAAAAKEIGRPDPVSAYVRNLGQATEELGKENIAEARELGAGVGGGKAGDIAQGLGATFTVSAPAIPAAVLGGLPAAATVAGATQFGISRGDYKDYFQKRGDDEATAERKAEVPALIGGAITATLTRVIPGGTEMLLQRLSTGELTRGGLTQIVKRGVSEVLKEMPEEGLDQIGQGFTEKLLVNPNKSIEEIANETGFAMAAAGVMAGTTAGGLIAIGKTAEAIARPIERRLRPLGERTRNAIEERQEQEVIPVERAGTETQRTATETGTGNRVLPAAQVEPSPTQAIDPSTFIVSVQASQGEVPGNIQIVDPAQTERSQSPTVESLRASGVNVPDFTMLPQGQYPWSDAVRISGQANQLLPQPILQGDQRSPQQGQIGKSAPIPAAPPVTSTPSLWNQIDTSTEPQAISRPEIDSTITQFKMAYPNTPEIVVVDTEAQLPAYVLENKTGRGVSAGVKVTGEEGTTIYITADRATSAERLKAVLAHEAIGHYGIESVFGKDFQALAFAVEKKMRGSKQWMDTVMAYNEDEFTVGQELIARMAEGNIQDLSLWEQVVAFIRKWWRDHVSRTNPISDAEIRKALADARKFLQGTVQAAQTSSGTSFAEEQPTPEENPFDKMRRESGAEPPPELTPEQQSARDRNEKQRGMRPNPLTSFALEPVDQAAYENGDDVWVTHKIGGNPETKVRDRVIITTETTVGSQVHAREFFERYKVPVEWVEIKAANPVSGAPSRGYWKYVKVKNHEAGRAMVQGVMDELNGPNTDERALLLGSLINSIRYNGRLRHDVEIFDAPTRTALAKATWHEASIRGAKLQELAQHPGEIDDIGMNADVVLERIWHDAFGGEVIDGVMAEIRRGAQAYITRPLIQHILAQNPTLQGALDLVTVLNEDLKGLPDAVALLEEVFQTPFYNLADFGKALEKRLIEQYKVDPKEAAKIAKEFQAAFNPSLKQGANEALKTAVSNLSYDAKAKVKGKRSVEALVTEAINKGALESGDVLRKIAKDNHWNPPADEQIDQMKRLSDRLVQLKNLKPADLAERKKMGATDQDIENARRDKAAKLGSEIARVRRDMETAWAKMTKPVSLIYGLPFIGQPEIRANTARAINEFIAANLLAKFGFGTRQFVAIFSQFVSFVPTRAIANALVNNAHAKNWQEKQPFIKEVAGQLRDGYKQQFGAIRPALAAAQAAFLGRGGGQQIGQLMSGLNALDRLTKQAEEQWSLGNQTLADGDILKAGSHFARSGLLYFFSSVKLGYRIAQGLDRLQGIPAHYQNMRAQVVRALMDAGKTRLEADNSADLVIGDMNAQWMLATAAVRDEMLAEGIEVTPQRVRPHGYLKSTPSWRARS